MLENTLVSAQGRWVQDPAFILLDARSGPDAAARFMAKRLAGARFVDLETDLSSVPDDAKNGGRHPLPSIEQWAATLGRLGITPQSRVVVYDDKGGANAAARTWWMLRAVGHEAVAVLDGGMQAAIAAGHPTQSGEPAKPSAVDPYPVEAYRWPTVSYEEVAALDTKRLLIDVRAVERYRGEVEPIDPVAGHLPGATNYPLRQHLGDDGCFLPREVLHAQMSALLAGRRSSDTIYSCGSGVTACHGILAMVHAGFEPPALYVGSWSEWCRRAG